MPSYYAVVEEDTPYRTPVLGRPIDSDGLRAFQYWLKTVTVDPEHNGKFDYIGSLWSPDPTTRHIAQEVLLVGIAAGVGGLTIGVIFGPHIIKALYGAKRRIKRRFGSRDGNGHHGHPP